jgi:hypothetical protein
VEALDGFAHRRPADAEALGQLLLAEQRARRQRHVDDLLAQPQVGAIGERAGVAAASRHYLADWYEHPDDLIGLIRDPWVGGRPLLPDSLPVIDRLPGHSNAFVATGHGMLGVTLAPASGHALSEFMVSGRRPPVLAPFRADRF